MLLNTVLGVSQKFCEPIYKKSFVLQKIDWLIFANILLVIISSGFMQSDSIGYFALFAIILTVIKFLTKKNAAFSMTTSIILTRSARSLISLSIKEIHPKINL